METFITILIDVVIVVLVFRWIGKRTVSSQLGMVKKNPKKYLTDNIDDSVRNKERLLQEIEKIDKIIKIDYWGWIKGSFKNPQEKKDGTTTIEALVKRVDGQEIWYKFMMKNNKLISLTETYKPIT